MERKWVAQGKDLENILVRKLEGGHHKIRLSAETGAWMLTMSICLNSMVLTLTKFCDKLALCFGYPPTDLSTLCDGCGESFTVVHVVACKKGRSGAPVL